MEAAIGPLRGSGVRAQAPAPIQKSMKHPAAAAVSPASSAAAAPATAARIPSASLGGGDSASSSANKVGSYKASARTRFGRASAAISATAAPYECPTSAK